MALVYEAGTQSKYGQLRSTETDGVNSSRVNLTSPIYFNGYSDSITGDVVVSVMGAVATLCQDSLIGEDLHEVIYNARTVYTQTDNGEG